MEDWARQYEEDAHGVTACFERATAESAATADEPPPPTEVARANLLVGADGVRSVCRALKFGDAHRYVGVVVVLGVAEANA